MRSLTFKLEQKKVTLKKDSVGFYYTSSDGKKKNYVQQDAEGFYQIKDAHKSYLSVLSNNKDSVVVKDPEQFGLSFITYDMESVTLAPGEEKKVPLRGDSRNFYNTWTDAEITDWYNSRYATYGLSVTLNK